MSNFIIIHHCLAFENYVNDFLLSRLKYCAIGKAELTQYGTAEGEKNELLGPC